ncbi:Endonuclease/exonuclease/phosphatase [Dillenia turbinata]|uniref:Endonuclease/exonuclease/phosphatase n=1 Tax=Dillenia turbinata TaxID=194707 RepID=A0AAN8VIR6_9MAGN
MSTAISPLIPKFIPVEENQISSRKKDIEWMNEVHYGVGPVHSRDPQENLWKTRSQAILTVLKGLGADFLCLQKLHRSSSSHAINLSNERDNNESEAVSCVFFKVTSVVTVIGVKMEQQLLRVKHNSGGVNDALFNFFSSDKCDLSNFLKSIFFHGIDLSSNYNQELDEYDAFYKRNIECHGYSSIYIQRSGQKRDGCGIFFKQDMSGSCAPNSSMNSLHVLSFSAELVLEEKIEYNDLVRFVQDGNISDPDNYPVVTEDQASEIEEAYFYQPFSGSVPRTSEDGGDPNDPRVRLKRDCVGIMGAFRLKASFDHFIIVANTHLDPEWADVKLAQAKYLLSRLAQFRTLVAERFECSPSVLLAGDFNSTPGDKVYQYLFSGHSSFKEQLECSEELPISLSSVYAFTKGEPAFTNCTPDFTGTLDYIFFCPSEKIKPISFLEVPLSDSADVEGGLPNYFHPSDHLPIGAEFEVTKGI